MALAEMRECLQAPWLTDSRSQAESRREVGRRDDIADHGNSKSRMLQHDALYGPAARAGRTEKRVKGFAGAETRAHVRRSVTTKWGRHTRVICWI
jgi:hypothetical protein